MKSGKRIRRKSNGYTCPCVLGSSGWQEKPFVFPSRFSCTKLSWVCVSTSNFSAGFYFNIYTLLQHDQLAQELISGATFRPALLKEGGTKNEDWLSSQIFALDFDNGCTIAEALNKCVELNILPAFGYTSFSHTEENHRFRLVFALSDPITDIFKRDKLQNAINNAFNESDQTTKNSARIFYGGKSLVYEGYDNRIDPEDIINRFYKSDKTKKINKFIRNSESEYPAVPVVYKQDDTHLLKIEAIRNLNVEVLRTLIHEGDFRVRDKENNNIYNNILSFITYQKNPPPIICRSQMEMYYTINHLDFAEFTGIYDMVNCVLWGHDDKTPSANVFNGKDDEIQIYHCFGCNTSRTIISFVEDIAQCTRSQAIDFIKKVYNIQFDITEKIKEQQQKMIDSANFLDTEEFKIAFPNLSGLIRTRKRHIQQLLTHFTQYITEDGIELDGKLLFWGSYKILMEVCQINPNKPVDFAKSITVFSLLNMIERVSPDILPEKLLKKAQFIAAQYNHKKLTNFYMFPEYGIMTLQEGEEIAKTLKEKNITLAGLSMEYVLRTFGLDVANRTYPQYKSELARGTSEKSDEKTIILAKRLMENIINNGYCLEKDIVTNPNSTMYTQWKRSITEICESYGLKKYRLNKELKAQYNINCKGYPSVILKA